MTKENEPFNLSKLGRMCQEIATVHDVEEVKTYIQQYFFHTFHGVFYYDMRTKQFLSIGSSERGSSPGLASYLPNGLQGKYINGNHTEVFKARAWFINEVYERYSIVLQIGKPPIDHEQKTINMMGQLKYADSGKTYSQTTAEAQKAVSKMLNHIKGVWCSGNEKQYEYVVNWLSCSGRRKLKTALYLQSLEQTGKSLVIDFLAKVFGSSLVCSTANTETISTYTQFFEGKILCNINELPCASSGEFKKIMNKLKTLITDSTFDCRRMYEHPRSSKNTFNFILTSNNDSVSISTSNFKRYKMLDVSNSMIDNHRYFKDLAKSCLESDSCAEAFFLYLEDHYSTSGSSFNDSNFPVSTMFTDKINERLDPVYNFIKFKYIKRNIDIDLPLKVLYRKFKRSKHWGECTVQKSDKKFSKMLRDLKSFVTSKKTFEEVDGEKTRCMFFTATAKELRGEFQSKSWIHELDEIDIPTETALPAVDDDESDDDLVGMMGTCG